MVLAEEFSGPALLERVELYATHASQATGNFQNARILLCETTVSALSTSFEANYAGGSPMQVFSADTLSIKWAGSAPGWNGFDLDIPFEYSGTQNLIVEFRYLGHDGKTVNARAASLPSGNRCLSAAYPTSSTGTLMSFLTCMRLHYGASALETTTFGAVKALFRLP
ncbi:MAG: hypothetical protein R6V62_07945 [Candidatus Fermentibacteraceae bacterium]